MKKTKFTSILSFILCLVLIAAVALMTWGCNDNGNDNGNGNGTPTESESETDKVERIVKGEGDTVFYFDVVDKDGNETNFEIHTNETTVGAALLSLGLIDGDVESYGLYVKVVNGITADYNMTGTYWAFYVNGAYGMTGVDQTAIEPGAIYEFRVE